MINSKDILILWDKSIFDGEKRLLPNSRKIYTQIYNIPNEGDAWSLVVEFEETAQIQGYESMAKAYFLVKEAPHNILKKGFKFNFLDGRHTVGICEVI